MPAPATMVPPRWEDLEFGSLLGEGAFSRVKHAKNVRTGHSFALKVVEKRQVQAQGRFKSIVSERSIHASLEHEGIARLFCAWHDESSFYFALELVEGGELAGQISRMGTCSLGFAQFYAAEIVVILEYLRLRSLAHRDLKPENLLLTLTGHLKLIDFDAAVVVPDEGDGDTAGGGGGKDQKMCCAGTSSYLPPEVVAGTAQFRFAFALDLWALGCIIYQILLGETPFRSSPEYVVFQRILAGEYSFPKGFQHREARSLIEALLSPDPGARPSMSTEGFSELKRHGFFGGSTASFAELLQCRPPPRVDRVSRRFASSEMSEDSSHSFDFASSAECTPEVGQQFLARQSDKVPVSQCSDSGPSEFTLMIQTDHMHVVQQYESHPRSLSPKRTSSPSSPTCAPKKAALRADRFDDISPPATPANSSRNSHASQLSMAAIQVSSSCRWLHPGRPFLSWPQWLNELVARRTLMEEEGVVICGSVVRRSLPCLRPKVLMLTDTPRLLILNSSGVRLLDEIPLAGCHASQVVAQSKSDFELLTSRRRYSCYDVDNREEWEEKIEAAREKVLRQQQGGLPM